MSWAATRYFAANISEERLNVPAILKCPDDADTDLFGLSSLLEIESETSHLSIPSIASICLSSQSHGLRFNARFWQLR